MDQNNVLERFFKIKYTIIGDYVIDFLHLQL